jgi:integrase
VPVYLKGKGRWTVVIKFRGRRKDWIVRGSKEEAKAFEARERLKLEAADPDLDPRVVPTFSNFCVSHYRPHAELHLKGNTWYKRSSLLSFLMKHFGELKLTEIHGRAVDDYKKTRRDAGLKPVSINNELRVLRIILNFARLERKLPVADVHIKFLEEDERRVRAWTRKEIDRLLIALKKEAAELLPIVLCLLNTGMRKGEALALTWPQIDFERREVRIWPSDEWQPKDKEPREVPISDDLWPFFKRSGDAAVGPLGRYDS